MLFSNFIDVCSCKSAGQSVYGSRTSLLRFLDPCQCETTSSDTNS